MGVMLAKEKKLGSILALAGRVISHPLRQSLDQWWKSRVLSIRGYLK